MKKRKKCWRSKVRRMKELFRTKTKQLKRNLEHNRSVFKESLSEAAGSLEHWFSWRFHHRKPNPPKREHSSHTFTLITSGIESTLSIPSSLQIFSPTSLPASDQPNVGNTSLFRYPPFHSTLPCTLIFLFTPTK
ncbi:hypothetical protein E2542_SST21554 [Spatholobus suberectus]|nr:hypothetical protein E2542_SST21554 [Spatholobus suberectus]